MPVEVRPDTFSMVFFDAAEIRAIVEKLVAEIGLPDDLSVTIEVDETTPMGRAKVASLEPLVITAESGALEDVKAPRQLSPQGSVDVLGKLLLSVRDRLDPGFGTPPADDDLSLQESVAWEVYCVARLGRLGHTVQRQRRLYQFRNRHGFTDAADAAFDRLWSSEDLTWADISATSRDALAALPA
jgi:hypothetical protein